MITFLLGLAVVLFLGGAVARSAFTDPGRTPHGKDGKRPGRKRPGAPGRRPQRRGGTARQTWEAAKWAYRYASPGGRQARRYDRMKQAHEAAKQRGETAATNPTRTVVDRRGWRGAWEDLREAWRRRDQNTAPDATPDPAFYDDPVSGPAACPGCGEVRTVTIPAGEDEAEITCRCGRVFYARRKPPDDPPDDAEQPDAEQPEGEQDRPGDDQPEQPKPQTDPTGDDQPQTDNRQEQTTMPTYTTLFEQGDQLDALPFEHVFQIEQFIKALHEGTSGASNMYFSLAARMNGPMSIDPIVTEPVERCGTHQRAIAAAVGDADVNLSTILSGTTEQLLERGIRVPRPELLNGEQSFAGAALVPGFFETAHTVAGRAFGDIRDVHCLIKALDEASACQARMYRRIAVRLADEGVDASVVERFHSAERHQAAITAALGDADTAMTRLLNMTLRELAASNLRAPNAHLLNV